MAAADGSTPQPLAVDQEHIAFLRQAAEQARRYQVFALLRAAEARAGALPRIGQSRLPRQNVVDLNQTPTLAFPAPTVESIEFRRGRAAVNGYYLGLTGPMGPLPLHLTEFAQYEARYAKQRPFGRFLNLLAGRMLQFFFRAWADSQPAAHADRPDDDRFAGYLAAVSGAAEGAKADGAFPARARLHYAGLFASKRSAAGIQDGLSHLLRTSVKLQEFLPRWRPIEAPDRTRIGRTGGGFNRLGGDAVIGGRVRGVSDAFRVRIETKSFREYEAFLPTGGKFAIAAEALDAFAPSHLEWELQLELAADQARPATLDGRTRLGWTSWLALKPSGALRADARLGRAARLGASRNHGGRHHDGD
jgi:type VI secretion system protein ImpH